MDTLAPRPAIALDEATEFVWLEADLLDSASYEGTLT